MVVLVPCQVWKCVPTAISGGVDISKVPGCYLLWWVSSQWGSQKKKKILQGLVSHELTAYLSVFNLFLTQRILAIWSKGCKPDNFVLHYSLKLSFMSIQGRFNFVGYESFLKSNSHDILAECETNLDDSIGSGNFSVRGYLPLTERILLLICMALRFMWKKDFLLDGTYL